MRKRRTKRARCGDSPELRPIPATQAHTILADAELRAECERRGVDLGLIVNNLRVPVRVRLERLTQGLRMAGEFYDLGTRMGLHK